MATPFLEKNNAISHITYVCTRHRGSGKKPFRNQPEAILCCFSLIVCWSSPAHGPGYLEHKDRRGNMSAAPGDECFQGGEDAE